MKNSSLKPFSINAHAIAALTTHTYYNCILLIYCIECYYSKSMVNNGDVEIKKPSDRLVAHSVSPVRLLFFTEFKHFTLNGSHSAA